MLKNLKNLRFSIKEALSPEQKMEVDTWERGDHSFSNHVFGDQHRVHAPLEFPDHKSQHQEKIEAHLEPHGIKVHDYVGGFGTDKHGRQVAIGKALVKTKAEPDLINGFANDPMRQQLKAFKDYHITISRHPHDVAGMTSSGQSWENESCMNFSTGSNRHYLKRDVLYGTHVAYLTHKDDKDIEKPLARIALKPYTNEEHGTVLRPEHRTYGNAPDAFTHTMNRWVNKHFPGHEEGIYHKDEYIYDDTGNKTVYGKKAVDKMLDNYNHGEWDEKAELRHFVNMSKGNLSSEHIHMIMDKVGMEQGDQDDHFTIPTLIDQHDLDKSHRQRIIDSLRKDSDSSLGKVYKSQLLSKLSSSDSLDNDDVSKILEVEPIHREMSQLNGDDIRMNILRGNSVAKRLSEENIQKFINHKYENQNHDAMLGKVMAEKLDLKDHHLKQMIPEDKYNLVGVQIRKGLLQNENKTTKQLNTHMNHFFNEYSDSHSSKDIDARISLMKSALWNKNYKPEKHHIDFGLEHGGPYIAEGIASLPNISHEHVARLAKYNSMDVHFSLLDNPHLTKEHHDAMAEHASPKLAERMVNPVFSNNRLKLTKENFDHLLSDNNMENSTIISTLMGRSHVENLTNDHLDRIERFMNSNKAHIFLPHQKSAIKTQIQMKRSLNHSRGEGV